MLAGSGIEVAETASRAASDTDIFGESLAAAAGS